MASSVEVSDFLCHVPAKNQALHRELLEEIEGLERVHAHPSRRKPNCYDVFVDGLKNPQEHVMRVQGTAGWKHSTLGRDLKVVWNPEKLGDRAVAEDYATRWEPCVKPECRYPNNPDSAEVDGGLRTVGVEMVVRILTGFAEFVKSSS